MKQKKKTHTHRWQDSAGKKLLMQDLACGKIAVDGHRGDAAEIYASRLEFGGTNADELKKFPSRLRSARHQTKKGIQQAAHDSIALTHDRSIYPVNPFNERNEPRWEGSNAEKLLNDEIKKCREQGITKKPKELYESEEAYRVFSPRVFRGHVYQEIKRQKFVNNYKKHS